MKGESYKLIVQTVLGFLEVFRRFVWNFFRLENEHLNNCGQFRAVRDISISPIQVTDLAIIEKMMDIEDGIVNRNHTLATKNSGHHNQQLSIHKKWGDPLIIVDSFSWCFLSSIGNTFWVCWNRSTSIKWDEIKDICILIKIIIVLELFYWLVSHPIIFVWNSIYGRIKFIINFN